MAPSANGVADAVGDYKPGSIKRIKLRNFLTYGDVVINPGPRFNMVVGANGTGKSSILCAICLGLGGDPKLLGRADDARSFIMNEKNSAYIELELTPQPGQPTHILQRKIDRDKGSERGNGRGASTFYINDKKVNVKEIQQLVKETYHISIDNLCTFLPQDKVGSFSGFSPPVLLLETEKTLSCNQHLYTEHLTLIEKEQELNSGDHNVETVEAKLAKLNAEKDRFEREKQRMEEREEAVRQADLLKTKIMWDTFNRERERVVGLKEQKNEMRRRLQEAQAQIDPLEKQQADIQQRKAEVDKQFKSHDLSIQKKKKEMSNNMAKADNFDDSIEETYANLNNIDSARVKKQEVYDQCLEKVENYKRNLEGLPSREEIEKEFEEAAAEKRAVHKDCSVAHKECRILQNQFKELESKAHELEGQLAKLQDEKAQRKQRVLRHNQNLQKAAQWLEPNRKNFRRRVWGPIACEVSPRTANAAAFLEEHVPNTLLKSFVVEDKTDYDFFYEECRKKLNIPINIVLVKNGNLLPFDRIYSDSKMGTLKEEHGVIGYLDESFTAPAPVMQALIAYGRVNKVLVGGEKTQESIDDKALLDYLAEPDASLGQNGVQASCIFASQGHKSRKYTTIVSRYTRKKNVDISDINPARMLAPGVDPKRKEHLQEKLKTVHDEMGALRPSIEDAENKRAELERKGQELSERAQKAKDGKETFDKVRMRFNQSKAKLQSAEEDLKTDDSKKKRDLMKKMMNAVAQLVTVVENHGSCHEVMVNSTTKSAGSRINKDIVTQLERAATQAVIEKRQEFEDIQQQGTLVQQRYNQSLQALRKLKEENDRIAPIKDSEGNDLPLKAEIDALDLVYDSIEECEAALEEAEQKVSSSHYDPNAIRQYEDTLKEIEREQAKLDQMKGNKDSLVQYIEDIRKPWEAALDHAVVEVNKLFVQYMAELGCTGEVRLKKGDEDSENSTGNFKEWGIEISVSFREGVKAQVLSAQVQSGGERSVSTIMYLMALQERMVSPFRCVDEINQGLDDRNERLVFKRIVENSTQPPKSSSTDHAGQYFLITPKLLPNLIDMETEATTVLIVTNGPFNFDSPQDFDIDVIAGTHGRKRAIAAGEDEENTQNVPRSRKTKKRRSSVSAEDEE